MQVWRISDSFRRGAIFTGAVLLLIAVIAGAFAILDLPVDPIDSAELACAAATFLTMGTVAISYAVRTERFTVITTDEAIQIGTAPPIAWSRIDGLRERGTREALVLLSGGMRVGAVEYAITNVEELVDVIVQHVRVRVPDGQRQFGSRQRWWRTALDYGIAAAVAFVVFRGWGDLPAWSAYPLIALLFVLHATQWRNELLSIEVAENELRLRTRVSTRVVPRGDLRAVRLLLVRKRRRELQAMLELRSMDSMRLHVHGVPEPHIYAAIRDAYPELV